MTPTEPKPASAVLPWDAPRPVSGVQIHRGSIGPWIIGEPLADGGCADIYYAFHETTGAQGALKLPKQGADDRAMLEERLHREARLLSLVDHLNVIGLLDAGALPDGRPYLVTELAEGEDLGQRIEREEQLDLDVIAIIGAQLLRGLSALAGSGIVHRDLKPENLMLSGPAHRPRLRILDFGIARSHVEEVREGRLTVAGGFVGTPHYAAPEQLTGQRVDIRADLYAAAAVLYECITGRLPIDGDSPMQILSRLWSVEPLNPQIFRPECPTRWAVIIERALAKDPSLRFATPSEMLRAFGGS